MLKAAENIVKIEGILSEIDIETGSYMKNGQSCDRISGSIKIRVNQKLNGEDKELDIPVYLFANKLKNDGKPNPAYTSIEKLRMNLLALPPQVLTQQIVFVLLMVIFV